MTLAAILILVLAGLARAGEKVAAIVPDPKSKEHVAGLTWIAAEESQVELEVLGDEFKAVATLEGEYKTPEWSLLYDKNRVKTDAEGRFKIEVSVSGKLNPITVTAVGPVGEIVTESFLIMIPSWEAFKKAAVSRPPKRFYLLPGAGFTYLKYAEAGKSPFAETALTVKAAITWLMFPPRWDFGFNAFMNVLPLTTSSPEGHKARFLGANVRFGFAVPFISEPWRLSILGGVAYTTMFPNALFGYKNVTWPQIYPILRRVFRKGRSAYLYGKFASVSKGSVFSFKDREFAFGLGYIHPLSNGHPISFAFDYSNTSIDIGRKTERRIDTSSLSWSGGYGW